MPVRFRTVLGLRLRSDRVLAPENGTNGEPLFGEGQYISDSYRNSRYSMHKYVYACCVHQVHLTENDSFPVKVDDENLLFATTTHIYS